MNVTASLASVDADLDTAVDSCAAEVGRLAHIAPRPTSVAQTGLSLTFLAELVSKHLATAGVLMLSQIVQRVALAGPVLEQVLNALRSEGRIEVRARPSHDAELRYGLTEKGRAGATEALARSGYVGPAPVPLPDYTAVVARQSVHATRITRQVVHAAFEGMVIAEDLLDRLGPALNSHRAIFLYGLPGTGKTYCAHRLARALSGLVLIPHAIAVNETIVEVFDPICHLPIDFVKPPSLTKLDLGFDMRYVPCERPVVLTGGELAADMLEVQQEPRAMRNLAPIQLKANNGFLLIDDLGRQRVEPVVLFNRWIVPMESRRDSLTAGGGRHFEVPFDIVVVFATNLTPGKIADDAFLRRLGYKIEFMPISADAYRRIWADECSKRHIGADQRLVDFVIRELHAKQGVPLLPCHPRDLLTMAYERAMYLGDEKIDETALGWAWRSYFVDSGGGGGTVPRAERD